MDCVVRSIPEEGSGAKAGSSIVYFEWVASEGCVCLGRMWHRMVSRCFFLEGSLDWVQVGR